MAKTTKSKPQPLADVADFDAETPPERRRPIGEPAPFAVELSPGESALEIFRDYDAKGRVPAGSVLAEFVGDDAGRLKHSGYVVAGNPVDGSATLGAVGKPISPEDRRRYRIVAHLDVYKPCWKQFCVLAPKE